MGDKVSGSDSDISLSDQSIAFKFITVSVGNLHLQTKKYSLVLEAKRTCKQITKSTSTLGEMILGLPERKDDNR